MIIRPLGVVVAAFCATVCAIAAVPLSIPDSGVDPAIKPGDDFFAYANGDWLKATEIPAGKPRVTARTQLDDLVRPQIAKLLDEASSSPAGSLSRKVADFRSAFLDEAAIENRGIAPLKPQLDRIDAVHDKQALTRLLGEGMLADVDPLNWGVYQSSSVLGLSVEHGNNGERTNLAFLLQGGLGLPDRDDYVGTAAGMVELRHTYQDYIAHLMALAGFDHAPQRAAAILALETALAQAQATVEVSAVDHNADNLWTRADFAQKAPGMNWEEFFAGAGMPAQPAFVAWQPSAVKGVAALVGSQPLEVWQDYLRFQLLDRYADVLPHAFAEPALALHAAASGQPATSSRAQRALAAIQGEMTDALGRIYVERFFPPESKARLQGIIANVEAALQHRVAGETWMGPESRKTALAKLQTLYVGLGYPEKWEDYSDLSIDPADPLGNRLRIEERNYRHALARLGQPTDMHVWAIAPQTVGAILIFQQNAVEFPAALLQPPKFDPAASDAAIYGSIGAIVGHESSHFIDPLGADYEISGANHHWWTSEDAAHFAAVSEPLAKQFAGYHPFPDLAINGKLTSSENIADLAGLSAAFDAYRLALGPKAADKAYVRQQDREFFIAFARSWRSKLTEAALRTQATTNDHAPEMYRISTVRNLDAWYDAFDVKPGDRLYLAPKDRVKIW